VCTPFPPSCGSCLSSHMSFLNCDSSGGATTWTEIRISPVFAIWVTGTLGAAFPILAHRSCLTRIPSAIFEYVSLPGTVFISQKLAASPNMSVLVSSLPQQLSTSSPLPLATSPHHVLESSGKAMCALYLIIFFPIIPILIGSCNVALPPGAYFPAVLHHLYYRDPCLPHWRSQTHESWYSL